MPCRHAPPSLSLVPHDLHTPTSITPHLSPLPPHVFIPNCLHVPLILVLIQLLLLRTSWTILISISAISDPAQAGLLTPLPLSPTCVSPTCVSSPHPSPIAMHHATYTIPCRCHATPCIHSDMTVFWLSSILHLFSGFSLRLSPFPHHPHWPLLFQLQSLPMDSDVRKCP